MRAHGAVRYVARQLAAIIALDVCAGVALVFAAERQWLFAGMGLAGTVVALVVIVVNASRGMAAWRQS